MSTSTAISCAVGLRLRRLKVMWLRHQLASLDRREAVYLAHIRDELDYSAALRIDLTQMLSETARQRQQLRAKLRTLWRI